MRFLFAFICICAAFLSPPVMAQNHIIDMHMHSYTDSGTGTARNGTESSTSADELLTQTIQRMDQHHIRYAAVSGTLESIEYYTEAVERFIPGYPDLRVYLMHAGENFFENTLRMMDGYPNLHVDWGVSLWLHPLTQDYAVRFLKSAQK